MYKSFLSADFTCIFGISVQTYDDKLLLPTGNRFVSFLFLVKFYSNI